VVPVDRLGERAERFLIVTPGEREPPRTRQHSANFEQGSVRLAPEVERFAV
jgi:hypothetical protein